MRGFLVFLIPTYGEVEYENNYDCYLTLYA